VVDDERANLIGNVLEAVHHAFKVIINVIANDVAHGICIATLPARNEQGLATLVMQVVGVLLDANDLLAGC
jgi:hypothetical protein